MLAGPVLGGAAVGVIGVLTALLTIEPPERDTTPFTDWGAFLFVPERDIATYLAGALLSLLLIVGLAWLALRRQAGRTLTRRDFGWIALYQLVVIGVGTGGVLAMFFSVRVGVAAGEVVPSSYFPALAVTVGIIGAVAVWADLLPRPGRGGSQSDLRPPGPERRLVPGRPSLLDVAVMVLIVGVVYLYGWRDLAGELLRQEGLTHWDYFALGPALSFSRGLALGTDVYSAYGVGWPVLFAALDPWIPVSPGRMLQIGSIYACVYLAGFYLALRLLVARRWAVFGAMLGIATMFAGLGQLVLWRFPSLSMLRWPMDIWCFIAVIMHLRTGRRRWAVAGGAVSGLGVVFATDTGLYLGAAFAFYWAVSTAGRADKRRHLGDLVAAAAAAAGTVLVGLGIGGRGDLLDSAFWKGWLETVLEFVGGIGMLPLGTIPNIKTVLVFVAAFLIYLATAGHTLVRVVDRSARPVDVLCGVVAIYGILLLLHFVGRSGDGTPTRLVLPLILIATVALARINERSDLRLVGSRSLAPGLTALVLLGLVVAPAAVFREPFSRYPNVFTALDDGAGGRDPCLMREPRDICGLPPQWAESLGTFHDLVDRLKRWEQEGATFAVLDETGSLFYLETQSPPWGRYSLVFASLHTKQQVEDLLHRLDTEAPDYVLTRAEQGLGMEIFDRWPISPFGFGPREDSIFWDSWVRVRAAIEEDYRLQGGPGPFQIWAIADGRPASG